MRSNSDYRRGDVSLAHLSDPHIGPIATPRLRELMNKRGLGLINWYRKRHRHHHADVLAAIVTDMQAQSPGHIAVTGDLVNVSLDTEFAGAARWLDERWHAGARDARAGQSRRLYPPRIGLGRAALGRIHARRRRRGLSLRAPARTAGDVGLTTSLPTGPFMATGHLGGEQLARLAEMLIALSREPLFRVVLIHHPPIPNKRHYMKRLIDGPMFRAMIAEHGAELVLHGHNHEQQLMWLDGPKGRIPAIGVPSASAIESAIMTSRRRTILSDRRRSRRMVMRDDWCAACVGREGITELMRQRLIR